MNGNNEHIKLRWDPTISLGQVASVVIFMLAGLGAWYNLKQEVAVHKSENDTKFAQVDKTLAEHKEDIRTQANLNRETSVELKLELRSNRIEIMQELRDLRAEVKKR